MPVINRAYTDLLDRYPDAIVGILDEKDILSLVPYVRKDIRKLPKEALTCALGGMGREVSLLTLGTLKSLAENNDIIMPEDDIARAVKARHPNLRIETVPVFLRWDRDNSHETSQVASDREVYLHSNDRIVQLLANERLKSSNWWRRVAALVIKDDEIISYAHNSSLPNEQTSWHESDPRIVARRGESIELSIDIHAEASIVADCARRGVSLEGASLYVTTFPCPNCAKLIATAGINQCYFIEGYASLDGERILRDFDVEIVKIDTTLATEAPESLLPYPTSS